MAAQTDLAAVHVGDSVQNGLNTFFGYIPNIIGFLVILAIGYFVAKLVRGIVNKALEKAHVDDRLTQSHAGGFVQRVSPDGRPSRFLGAIVFWLIFLYALTAAIGALKIPAVTTFMNEVLAYLPNVIAAAVIFVVASLIATAVVALVQRTMGDTPTGKIVETVVPGLVMAIAVFMILTQLHIATAIVTITYAALLGMLALAGALAFGLGGRDVAARLLESAYANGQSAREQVRADAATGRSRAQDQVQRAQQTDQPTEAYSDLSSRAQQAGSVRATGPDRR